MFKIKQYGKTIVIGEKMAIVFFIITIICILIVNSKLRIKIEKFELKNKKIIDFRIIASLRVFNKISWFVLKLDNKKIDKMSKKIKKHIFNGLLNSRLLTQFKNLDIRLITEWKEIFKKMDVEKISFRVKLGLEDASATAYAVGIISSILGIFISREYNKVNYLIEPIYSDKNQIYLSLNCILTVKLVHIIFNKSIKKRRVYQRDGITSNRRINANSHG